MQRFEFLRQPLLGELAMSRKKEDEERKKEREKMPFVVATYVYASSQGQRTHSARTNLSIHKFPIWMNIINLSKCEEIHNIMIVDRTGFLTVSKSGSGMELYSSQISRMFSSNFIASFALSVIFETSLN